MDTSVGFVSAVVVAVVIRVTVSEADSVVVVSTAVVTLLDSLTARVMSEVAGEDSVSVVPITLGASEDVVKVVKAASVLEVSAPATEVVIEVETLEVVVGF